MWSYGREVCGESLSVQFMTAGTYWIVGRLGGREVNRTGRYHGCGPATLAWVVSRILANPTTPAIPAGDPAGV